MPEAEQNESDLPEGLRLLRRGDQTRRGDRKPRGARSDVEPNVTTMHRILSITLLFLFAAAGVQAQRLPERSLVRKGNRQYNKGEYEASIGRLRGGPEVPPRDSSRRPTTSGTRSTRPNASTAPNRPMVQAAADSLRPMPSVPKPSTTSGTPSSSSRSTRRPSKVTSSSLRLNPADMEAKYNYAYTKRSAGSGSERWSAGTTSKTRTRIRTSRTSSNQQQQNQGQNQNQDQKQDQQDQDQQNQGQNPQDQNGKPDQTGTGRGSTDPFGHLPARAGADARRHPGPGGQDPGETQGEGQGRRGSAARKNW